MFKTKMPSRENPALVLSTFRRCFRQTPPKRSLVLFLETDTTRTGNSTRFRATVDRFTGEISRPECNLITLIYAYTKYTPDEVTTPKRS